MQQREMERQEAIRAQKKRESDFPRALSQRMQQEHRMDIPKER